MLKIAIFVSGRGSNLKAVVNSVEEKKLSAEVKFVVSNKRECEAFKFASEKNIPVLCAALISKEDTISYKDLANLFKQESIDLIVLAGFLKKIPDDFIDEFPNRIINIHPALLPAFGGKGMYGMNVHKAVFASSAKVSGVTIHFVDKIYDNGKIITQKCVDIKNVITPEEIAEKVLAEEHKILPETIKLFSENKIRIDKDRVFIDG